jgi:hypothetical protein
MVSAESPSLKNLRILEISASNNFAAGLLPEPAAIENLARVYDHPLVRGVGSAPQARLSWAQDKQALA